MVLFQRTSHITCVTCSPLANCNITSYVSCFWNGGPVNKGKRNTKKGIKDIKCTSRHLKLNK